MDKHPQHREVRVPQEKIFLSAVTEQFKACRDALRSDLAAVGAEVVVQEEFRQHGGTLLQKLEQHIDSCDRVIALVGTAYGWEPEPAAIPEHAPPRSYTQWEYHFARGEHLDGTRAALKPVYLYFAAAAYLEEHPVTQPDAEAQRQQAFVAAIEASGKDRNRFDSIDHLTRLVLRDGFRLSSAGRWTIHNLPYDSLGPLLKGRGAVVGQIQAQLAAGTERATAIVAKQAFYGLGGEHPEVARVLNNLALLLQATNRLEEAEPLSRRMVEIFPLFGMRTGHEHPHLNVALGNHSMRGGAALTECRKNWTSEML